ncbi:MAG: hypothetical protein R3D02_10480, partial [Hyphomicrobiales bacterium]
MTFALREWLLAAGLALAAHGALFAAVRVAEPPMLARSAGAPVEVGGTLAELTGMPEQEQEAAEPEPTPEQESGQAKPPTPADSASE